MPKSVCSSTTGDESTISLTDYMKPKSVDRRAEVVKQVDAVDSKSTGLRAHAGSIPAFGTK